MLASIETSDNQIHTRQILEALPRYLRPHPHGGSQEVSLQMNAQLNSN
jgi:hypothetical protein